LPPGVVICLPRPAQTLAAEGALSSNLARWFQNSELSLPRLSERADDLRALSLDALARRCLELGREPLGLDAAALRLILEHSWPGNEAELATVLGRAAAIAQGRTLTAVDLSASGFRPDVAQVAPELTPLPSPARRRASRRPARGR
jgi:DNA-binding NtrC family response regulator